VIPLYYQLQQDLEAQIANGGLAPGSRVPAEDELIRIYGVSRATVRKAIQELERTGIVEIRRGKGTFVQSPKITQELTELTGFVEDMVALGLRPSAKVLERTFLTAPEQVARQLQLPLGSQVIHLKRVRLANDEPISFDKTYLPLDVGHRIAEEDLEVYPVFSLLEEKYNTPLSEAEYKVEAVSTGLEVAEALGVPTTQPVLLIERTSYSLEHRPVDYERLYYRADRIMFSMRLKRKRPSLPLGAIGKLSRPGPPLT